MILDLRPGVTETPQYKAWKFPGGEIHVQLKALIVPNELLTVQVRLNTTENLIFFLIVKDLLFKMGVNKFAVHCPYFPYQQADRDFSEVECFSLMTITEILRNPRIHYRCFDVHSDVTPALLQGVSVETNHKFIETVIRWATNDDNLILLSPDAGAYKKIFKLAQALPMQREVVSANKSRSISTGNIDSIELSREDFKGRPVLIVDDICMGGRTFIELAKKLKERNAGDLFLAVSHGIFSNGFDELGKYFTRVFTTNSFQEHYNSNIVTTFNVFE